MVEMKKSEVVLCLAAQLTSWRAILVLHTWATCKPRQRWNLHQYSLFLADCLNQSQQPVWESGDGAAGRRFRKVRKERWERQYADWDWDYGDCYDDEEAGAEDLEAMDPAGSPSSTRKVADAARPSLSPSTAIVPGWRRFFGR